VKKIVFPSVFHSPTFSFLRIGLLIVILISFIGVGLYMYVQQGQYENLEHMRRQAYDHIERIQLEITRLKADDQLVRNEKLSAEIGDMQKTYTQAVKTYEELVELRVLTRDTAKLDEALAASMSLLSQRKWSSASAQLTQLNRDIVAARQKIASSFVIPVNVPESNAPPSGGFSRQSVTADIGAYLVDIVAADMGSTRVIVDTASESTCTRDCPVLSLAEYASRNGAFAGINGSYFCPADYPSCAEKKNSFDTLLMNKQKVYFNSDNNVYSTVPAAIFLSGSMRFVGRSLDWGRDTSPDGVIANQPLLLSGGNIVFGGDGDPKKGSRGSRSFVGNKGSTAYIGVVHNATVAEVAHVLKSLGLENALNLDSGGSTALWSGGYKVGPGRSIPNAILFVRK
jgi:FtsZ-binding cell division protein ZapB